MPRDEQVQRQARALGDPTRHRIFQLVVGAGGPIGVAALTEAVGLHHNAVRQHLAKLVDAGLVRESVAPVSGRGRPRLQYEPDPAARGRWVAHGPYERLSGWLAEVIRTGDDAFEVGRRVGRADTVVTGVDAAAGAAAPDPVAVLVDRMAADGFDPVLARRRDRIEITLATCPFESTAVADPDTVCELHRGIAVGVAETAGGVVVDELVRKDPRRANCRLRCHEVERTVEHVSEGAA